MRPRPSLTYSFVILTILLSACSSSTEVDRERLDDLIADPMADYQPPTGELLSSYEEAGERYYAFGHGWEESSSAVVRRWQTTAPQSEIVDDVVAALEEADWTQIDKSDIGTVTVTATKPHGEYCAVAWAIISEIDGGRVELDLTAPYSGAEGRDCPDD